MVFPNLVESSAMKTQHFNEVMNSRSPLQLSVLESLHSSLEESQLLLWLHSFHLNVMDIPPKLITMSLRIARILFNEIQSLLLIPTFDITKLIT